MARRKIKRTDAGLAIARMIQGVDSVAECNRLIQQLIRHRDRLPGGPDFSMPAEMANADNSSYAGARIAELSK